MQIRKRCLVPRPAFTIVELLVVTAIVAISVASGLARAANCPGVRSVWIQCKDNLKRLGLALQNYHDTHDRFPYSTTCSLYGPANPNAGHTWVEFMFPYMDMSLVYVKLDFNSPITDAANSKALENLKLPG